MFNFNNKCQSENYLKLIHKTQNMSRQCIRSSPGTFIRVFFVFQKLWRTPNFELHYLINHWVIFRMNMYSRVLKCYGKKQIIQNFGFGIWIHLRNGKQCKFHILGWYSSIHNRYFVVYLFFKHVFVSSV